MAFFNDFKELFTNAAQSVSNKTRDGVEITRINSESRAVANDLASVYEEIGRIYVDSEGRAAGELSPLCARALELRERLEALERQRMQIRNQNRCPACGAIAAKEARFCSACGRRMPEPAPEQESPSALEDVHYCPECGAMRKEGDKFCAVCGSSYEQERAPEPAEPKAKHITVQPDDSDEAPTDFD